jgi:DNA-binding MarR family transcriptional regulator
MPLGYCAFLRNGRSVVLFLVACVVVGGYLFDASVVVSAVDSNVVMPGSSSLQVSDRVITNYSAVVSNLTVTTSTIVLNGAQKRLVELPAESVVVRLPEDRLAIASSQETSILPEGSTVEYYGDKPVVSLPSQSQVLGVSSVLESPLQNFSHKTNFIQSVEGYDDYAVQVVFFELVRDHLDVSLVNYSVDWGDGTKQTYAADVITVAHDYSKSGEYLVTFNASDSIGFTYVTSQLFTVRYEGDVAHSVLWMRANRTPIGLVSLSLGLLAVGLVAFTESGRYRLLALFVVLLPFYSRISKEDVLDQFVRGQIYGFIKTNPGVHYNQILRKVGVKNGTLSYHLSVLEKTELIQSRREGLKYRVFYPTGMSFPKKERFRLTDLQIQILESIKKHPGLTQKQIARSLGRKPQTINYNIKVLDQAGLVSVERRGRHTLCFPVADAGMPGE